MHPILLRIPLPHEFALWWGLAALAAGALLYAFFAFRQKQQRAALVGFGVVIVAIVVAAIFRQKAWPLPETLPIYSYGVMLGVSLVIGWYLSLTLADKDGLPKDVMATCYIVTAMAALVGARLLYVLTNLGEFHSFGDFFDFRTGGLVAYGGFLGGFLGSWGFLAPKKIRLMAWADDAVPSLASGLLVTRIGCYLYGCDYGKPLSENAPGFLKKLGTFPHWVEDNPLARSLPDYRPAGAPAFQQQWLKGAHDGTRDILDATNYSLPVHPTQLYESLVGLGLLFLLMWSRKQTKFRGQVFFVFVFAYGAIRFLLEIVRDDPDRGGFGPSLDRHVLLPLCLVIFAIAFAYGPSLGIKDARARLVARIAAFVPAVVVFLMLRPSSFAKTPPPLPLSTSQWVALLSACAVAFFYERFWQEAKRSPKLALALGEGVELETKRAKEEEKEDEDDEAEEKAARPDDASDPGDTTVDTPAAKKRSQKRAAEKETAEADPDDATVKPAT